MSGGALEMFVMYEGTSDYLGVVVRRWVVDSNGATPDARPFIVTSTTLEAEHALALVRPDLVRVAPFEGDDPTIVGVWL